MLYCAGSNFLVFRSCVRAHNFPSSDYFHKIFGMHLQKGLVYLSSKKVLPPLLHFWDYNPSPIGQIISFIGSQAHLQIQLLRDEWYQVLSIIHCAVSPAEKIEEEVKLQSYILSFLVFFHWIAIYESACKGLHEGTENCWSSF